MRLPLADIGSRIIHAYIRWRHSRGFGVHSPYAYRLVKEVLHPSGVTYYGYAEIGDTFNGKAFSSRLYREACMLLRLVNFLQPQRIFITPGAEGCHHTALRCADSRLRVVTDPDMAEGSPLWLVKGEGVTLEQLLRHLSTPGNALGILNPSAAEYRALLAALPEGVAFRSPRSAIFIHRPQTARIEYAINL